jgi:hypothetical protein
MKVTKKRPVVAGIKHVLGSPKIFERGLNVLAALILVLAMLSGIGGLYEVAFHADLGSTNGFVLALFKALGGTMLCYIVLHLATRHADGPTYVQRSDVDYGMAGLSDDGADMSLVGPIATEMPRRPRVKNIRGEQD